MILMINLRERKKERYVANMNSTHCGMEITANGDRNASIPQGLNSCLLPCNTNESIVVKY